MTPESVREYCISFSRVTESFPFGENALVFKVHGKMFGLLSLESRWLNLKCDPENAIIMRDQYEDVTPGYHMSKRHWNTINLDGTLPDRLIKQWIKDSYDLVFRNLPKKFRQG